jgi:Leucine-rich repeat (LRR) protein
MKRHALSLRTTIPDSFCQLRELILDKNLLEELDTNLGACTTLVVLSLSDNMVSVIPSSLGACTKLKTLNVSKNPVASPFLFPQP